MFSVLTRVIGKSNELLKDVPWYHPRLLPEDCVQLCLPLVVAEEVAQFLSHDGRLVFTRKFAVGSFQHVGLAETEGCLVTKIKSFYVIYEKQTLTF